MSKARRTREERAEQNASRGKFLIVCGNCENIWLSPINRLSNKIAWPTHVISELGSEWRQRWKKWLF